MISLVIVLVSMSCSNKIYKSVPVKEKMEVSSDSQSDEEGAVQEPAWTYFEGLSYLFGADSTCVGMTDDMDFPEWYSGCVVNDRNRLTINVIGDTLRLRHMLADLLGGDEFDLGEGVCSKNEQIKTRELMNEAISRNYSKIAQGNMSSGSNPDGTIDVCIQGDNDSIIDLFKREVFDSPILRFKVAEEVGIVLDFEVLNYNDKLFATDDSSPQFPGGQTAMLDYIYDNLRYPKEAYDREIQGRVYVKFLVDKTGDIDSVQILRSKDPFLDAEALRIVSTFPKFTPGKMDGNPIDQWMALPIMFKMSDYDERLNKKSIDRQGCKLD